MKSEKLYNWLHRLLIALLILEIVIGLSIVIVGEYFNELVQSRVFSFEKREVLNIFFVVKISGLHTSFYFLCGVPIALLLDEVYTRHLGLLIKLWMLMAVETLAESLVINWCFNDATQHLNDHFQKSLLKGIKLYPQDPTWVLIWDDLQYQFKCCGVYDHRDWLNANLTTTEKKLLKQSKEFCWLPFSCASEGIPLMDSFSDGNIYTSGCYTVVSRMINFLTSAVFLLNITSVILLVRIEGYEIFTYLINTFNVSGHHHLHDAHCFCLQESFS